MRKLLAALLMVPALAFGQGFWNTNTFPLVNIGPAGAQAILQSDGANILAQRNGASAQTERIYATYTDASNNEYLVSTFFTTSGTIITATKTGTGTQRNLSLGGTISDGAGGVAKVKLWTDGTIDFSGTSATYFSFNTTGNLVPNGQKEIGAARFNSNVGNSPTMGACGTTPALSSGKDAAFQVTVGSGGVATSCAINFSATWTNPPTCIAQNNTDRVSYSIVTSATVVTITATAAITAGSRFHVICVGQ